MSSCVDAVDVDGGGVGDNNDWTVEQKVDEISDDVMQAVYDHLESCDLVVKYELSMDPWKRCKELIKSVRK